LEEDTHRLPEIPERQQSLAVSRIVEELKLQCGVQGLGRVCQRLFDYGRLEYMRCVLYANVNVEEDKRVVSDLCYYVPPEITPQNAVLMAARIG
jgi:hypothetical protein